MLRNQDLLLEKEVEMLEIASQNGTDFVQITLQLLAERYNTTKKDIADIVRYQIQFNLFREI